ncbi:MAG: SDR family oxidoreductase [Deltaproteobacteria bacterium]|nr:SDR family oxidoreductase [Deltaproteobacteria bacterium]
MSPLDQKVFIITGGAGAIARPILRAFADAGSKLVVVDRTEQHARAAAAEVGGLGIAADLATPSGADAMVSAAIQAFGNVNGLIHTVGGFAMAKAHESDPALYDRMFDLNVRTLFHATRSVLPLLLKQKEGFLAAFSAAPALTGAGPGMSLYAAAKSAVSTFLRSVDAEVAGSNVRVAIVYPMGAVDTPANRKDMPDFDPARYIDPSEIAQSLVFAASRGARGRLAEMAVYPGR